MCIFFHDEMSLLINKIWLFDTYLPVRMLTKFVNV